METKNRWWTKSKWPYEHETCPQHPIVLSLNLAEIAKKFLTLSLIPQTHKPGPKSLPQNERLISEGNFPKSSLGGVFRLCPILCRLPRVLQRKYAHVVLLPRSKDYTSILLHRRGCNKRGLCATQRWYFVIIYCIRRWGRLHPGRVPLVELCALGNNEEREVGSAFFFFVIFFTIKYNKYREPIFFILDMTSVFWSPDVLADQNNYVLVIGR